MRFRSVMGIQGKNLWPVSFLIRGTNLALQRLKTMLCQGDTDHSMNCNVLMIMLREELSSAD